MYVYLSVAPYEYRYVLPGRSHRACIFTCYENERFFSRKFNDSLILTIMLLRRLVISHNCCVCVCVLKLLRITLDNVGTIFSRGRIGFRLEIGSWSPARG